MRPNRTLSTIVFALYLLLAGTLPVLDAMLERDADAPIADRGPLDGVPGTPHGDGCALCAIIDRTPGVTGAAGELSRSVVTFAAGVRWLNAAAPQANALVPALGARAPPPPLA